MNIPLRMAIVFCELLLVAGCTPGWITGYDPSDAIDYAEGKEAADEANRDPCVQDILDGVPVELRRCPPTKARQLTRPTAATEPTYSMAVVTAKALNVRSGPGPEFSKLGYLTRCSIVTVIDQAGEWLYVEGNRLAGYVHGAYISYDLDSCSVPTSAPPLVVEPIPAPPSNCDPAYPDHCLPPPPPDLDCSQVPDRNFRVLAPDPHGFDHDGDGVGCET